MQYFKLIELSKAKSSYATSNVDVSSKLTLIIKHLSNATLNVVGFFRRVLWGFFFLPMVNTYNDNMHPHLQTPLLDLLRLLLVFPPLTLDFDLRKY